MIWSGLGFNLFILAFCIELYPLINDFWTRTGIQGNNNPTLNFNYSNRYYNLFLANRDTTPDGTLTEYGNCITNAMKCALAIVVAFSSVLGRAGQLECLIITIVGVIGFELNRQLIQERIGADAFGTIFIFTFGGFMGLALGFFAYLRERKEQYTIDETSLKKYTADEQSVIYSVLGVLFIFVFFPFLAYDIDAYIFQNKFSAYVSPLILILAMGAGLIGSLAFSALFNGYVIIRDVMHGVIAGAIIPGAGSLYTYNPTYAIITGFIGGVSQALIQNMAEKKSISRGFILSTISWSLFGIQGVLGGIFAAGWKALANNRYSANFNLNVIANFGNEHEFYAMLIAMSFGVVFGCLAGVCTYFTNVQGRNEYFDDGYFWRNSDGIHAIITRKSAEPDKVAEIPPENKSETIFLDCEVGSSEDAHNVHAYL